MSPHPVDDYAGRQIGHLRVIEQISGAAGLTDGKTWWRCLCDLCGEWKDVSTALLRRAETRERCLGVKAKCRRCVQLEKKDRSAGKRQRGVRSQGVLNQHPTHFPAKLPESDRELAIDIADVIGLEHSFDDGGWPLRSTARNKETRFDPANDWNDALLALRQVLGENGDSPCRTFYRDLEFVLAGSTAILPDWPHAFGLLVEQGPRSVCAAILRCCPVTERSAAVVRS